MIRTSRELYKLYSGCMNCPVPVDACEGVRKDIPSGEPPRGFLFSMPPVKILVVGKNPGHPILDERRMLAGKSGDALLDAFVEFQSQSRQQSDPASKDARSLLFHKRLTLYLTTFLGVPESLLPDQVAHTNLVKCSTSDEQARLTQSAIENCYERYLSHEIELYRPKVLLALGREVERFLKTAQASAERPIPVIYVKHPSYPYRGENRSSILEAIKNEISHYLEVA